MMKYYLCVTPFFPSQNNWRGAYVLDQVKAIERNSEYKIVVFLTHPFNENVDDYMIGGLQVYSIRPLLMPSYILNGLTEGLVGDLFVRKLARIGINPMDVEYVHCHTANHAAFGYGVRKVNPQAKVLIQFHDLDPYALRNGLWAHKRWNVRFRARKSLSAFERADLLISISTPVQDNLLAFPKARSQETLTSYLDRLECLSDFPSLKSRRTYVLYNGVDCSVFKPDVRAKKTTGFFRIGCVANFQKIKDHITLLKAFDKLIKKGYTCLRLSLLGTGETRLSCENYIRDNGLSAFVEWPKEMAHDKLPEYYRSLDLFVLPCIYEGFGCVYTEAYTCGVPFIGVYDQGAAELIAPEERSKWLIPPHDYVRLAELIESYLIGHTKQLLCKAYDIDILIKDYLQYLELCFK